MRCKYCGSQRIHSITQKDGYSMKKGLVGAVVLGPVGAVAGIDGKTSTSLYCPVCHEESEYMDSALDSKITIAIINNNIDELRVLKAKYNGIEWEEGSSSNETLINDEIKQQASVAKSDDVETDILNYLNSVNIPSTFSDVIKRYKNNSSKEISDAILNLIENGRIKMVQEYLIVVRDIEELLALKENGAERRKEASSIIQAQDKQIVDEKFLDAAKKECQKQLNNALENKRLAEACIAEVMTEIKKLRKSVDTKSLESKQNKYQQEKDTIETKIKEHEAKLQEANAEFAKLGFFDRAQKKTIKGSISELEAHLEELKQKRRSVDNSIQEVQFQIGRGKSENKKNEQNALELEKSLDKDRADVEKYTQEAEEYKRSMELLKKGTLEGVSKKIVSRVESNISFEKNEKEREETIYPTMIEIIRNHGGSIRRNELVDIMKNHPAFSEMTSMRISATVRLFYGGLKMETEHVRYTPDKDFRDGVITLK